MKDRKILVEVTPEEYEKIVAGNLEQDLTKVSDVDLLVELIKRSKNIHEIDTYQTMYSRYTTAKAGTFEIKIDNKGSGILDWSYRQEL